jgi:Amt family ammonium transporter
VCGIWGTLAVGLFGSLASVQQLMSQLLGVAVIGGFVVSFTAIVGFLIARTIGLRVESAIEVDGLDHHEHEASAYRGLHFPWNKRAEDRAVIEDPNYSDRSKKSD